MADTEQPDLTAMTVQLLSAYFSNNQVPAGDIAGIIEATRGALEGKGEAETPAPVEHVPAISVRKSLGSREHILSMIDGKPYKTLKRHLATNGLTPAEYRDRYKLPRNYPMVAPAYSEHRRAVAEKLGLGRRAGARATAQAPAVEPAKPEIASPPAPAAEEKPKRTRARGVTAKSADQAPIVASEQAPVSAPVAAPAKPKRSRAKSATGKPATEAPVIVVEKTPETAPAVTDSPAPAPAARKSKVAIPKKTTAKRVARKTSDDVKKSAVAEEAVAAPTTSEIKTPEAAEAKSSAPAPRKKKLGIVTGQTTGASPRPKAASKRKVAAKNDKSRGDATASPE